jgi:hypothetical protein
MFCNDGLDLHEVLRPINAPACSDPSRIRSWIHDRDELAVRPFDVNVRWIVVIEVDHEAHGAEPQHRRHR